DSSGVLATSKVRAAAQYKKSQSEVWSHVDETNKVHHKEAASHTLMATLDDAEISRRRVSLTTEILTKLAASAPATELVGVAYAIDGQVQGARFFVHHRLFAMHRDKIVSTIAIDAITAEAEAREAGQPKASAAPPAPAAVDGFLSSVDAQP